MSIFKDFATNSKLCDPSLYCQSSEDELSAAREELLHYHARFKEELREIADSITDKNNKDETAFLSGYANSSADALFCGFTDDIKVLRNKAVDADLRGRAITILRRLAPIIIGTLKIHHGSPYIFFYFEAYQRGGVSIEGMINETLRGYLKRMGKNQDSLDKLNRFIDALVIKYAGNMKKSEVISLIDELSSLFQKIGTDSYSDVCRYMKEQLQT